MKTKLLLLSFLMLLTIETGYSQTSANTAGIAVQGIARDANNTARINTSVSLSFEIYYLNNSNNAISIYSENVTLQTDAFGVFSHVVDPGATNNAVIANNQAYIKISEGSTIISDEKLKHVPYAIAANNGVPTGSIMPFVGTTAPPGWVLCDGRTLTTIPGSQPLRDLLGSNNTPNLQAMFLRGTGSQTIFRGTFAGPSLNQPQEDDNRNHAHYVNLNTNSAGNHQHNINFNTIPTSFDAPNGRRPFMDVDNVDGVAAYTVVRQTRPAGDHSHNAQGWSGGSGTESRPLNYGVNYIIKL